MSRFLLTAPPLTGHLHPLLAVAEALRRQGHDVAWVADPDLLARLGGAGQEVFPTGAPASAAALAQRPAHLRGFAALQFLWEEFLIPLADRTVDTLGAAIAGYRPDVVLADQQMLSAPLAARRHGAVWATSASTGAALTDALAATPRIASWRDGLLTDLIHRHLGACPPYGGPGPDAWTSRLWTSRLWTSPDLVLAFTSEALVGTGRAPAGTVFVGPCTSGRAAGPPFPWHRLRPDRLLVIVSLGTVNSGASARFLRECLAAAALLPVAAQFVLADPGGGLDGLVGPEPDGPEPDAPEPDGIVARRLPLPELLGRASAVICHGGHNTVCEALGHGVPLVVAPIRDDQPLVAQQVVDAGAGVRVRFGLVGAAQLAEAVTMVLQEPHYARAADRIRTSFAAAGGADRAAAELDRLAHRSRAAAR